MMQRVLATAGVVMAGLVLASLTTAVTAEDLPESRPNILFVFADELGFGDLGAYGNEQVETPHLDRLAREGGLFRQFHVASGVCSPSRAAAMTGLYPARLGVHGHFAKREQNESRGMPNHLDPAAPMVSRFLQEAGYATGHFGKWHLSGSPHDRAPSPRRYGFDRARVWTGPSPGVFENVPARLRPADDDPNGRLQATRLSPAATVHAERFIRGAKQPWFVNLWLHETHHVVWATEEEKSRYAHVPEPQRTYLANVTRADTCVGQLLAALDELGQTDRTLVIFSSDNGPENSQPRPTDKLYYSVGETGGRRGRKRSLYLGGVTVPFVVRWPGVVPAGLVDDATLLGGVDLAPTFLAAAGVQPPSDYAPDGQDMTAALRGEMFERDRPLFWQWNAARPTSPADWPTLAMREGPYALVLATDATNRDEVVRAELFDVLADPNQQNDLAESQPEVLARMQAAALEWERTLPEAPRSTLNAAKPKRKRGTAPAKAKPAADRG